MSTFGTYGFCNIKYAKVILFNDIFVVNNVVKCALSHLATEQFAAHGATSGSIFVKSDICYTLDHCLNKSGRYDWLSDLFLGTLSTFLLLYVLLLKLASETTSHGPPQYLEYDLTFLLSCWCAYQILPDCFCGS